jgi:hypothetical protein
MAKTIEIKISPTGDHVEVDAQGFRGQTCTNFMESIMKALGGKIDQKRKPEFYQQVSNGQQLRS